MDNLFQFQQFTVRQNKSVFKVGTDAVLLGAWCDPKGCKTALDIGTGTGLLALMLAQQEPLLNITAIDNMVAAVAIARQNCQKSPFNNNIKILQTSVQDFLLTQQKFDIIISNPPFYDAGLLSSDPVLSQAKHTYSLTFEDLFSGTKQWLSEQGLFYVILPFQYLETIKILCRKMALYIVKQQAVSSFSTSIPHRILLCISKNEQPIVYLPTLAIRSSPSTYSEAYVTLTQSFYQQRAYL